MNQQILMIVLVVVVIGVISAGVMMSNSPETYTAASDFNPSKDIFIPGMKADGTIVLTHKFKDIDTAIDKAAAKIKTDYTGYTNTKISQYNTGVVQGYQTKGAMGGYYTKGQINSILKGSKGSGYARRAHYHNALYSTDGRQNRMELQNDGKLHWITSKGAGSKYSHYGAGQRIFGIGQAPPRGTFTGSYDRQWGGGNSLGKAAPIFVTAKPISQIDPPGST